MSVRIERRYPTLHAIAWRSASSLACFLAIALSATNCAYAIGWHGVDLQGAPCNGKGQGYGPYDYRHPAARQKNLPVVEQHHFGPSIRNLTARPIHNLMYNLDYTLRAFPNHHAALFTLINFETQQRFSRDQLKQHQTPPECYFQRAEAFAPDDRDVQLLYAIYLHKKGEHEDALLRYEKALKIDPDSAEAHYNMGLLLLDMERPEDALNHAESAYSLGYALPGLRNRLRRAGYSL